MVSIVHAQFWQQSMSLRCNHLIRSSCDHAARLEKDRKKPAVAVGIDGVVIMLKKIKKKVRNLGRSLAELILDCCKSQQDSLPGQASLNTDLRIVYITVLAANIWLSGVPDL